MTQTQKLADFLLLDTSIRPQLLKDCAILIENEVKSKSGLSGMGLKAAFKVIKKVRPGMIESAMDYLLEPFVNRLEPLFSDNLSANNDVSNFPTFLKNENKKAAELLLGVTDDRINEAEQKVIVNTYKKLRPKAKEYVLEAIPGVSDLFSKYVK